MHSLPRDAGRKYGIPSDRCQGGNGYVYKCRCISDGVMCAVKVLKNLHGDARERFRREIKVAKEWSIKTDRILPVLDIGKGDKWYSMPWAERYNCNRENYHEDAWAKFVTREIAGLAQLLARLHSEGIYHRDIKPANILLYKEHFVLSDFGLVKDRTINSDLTLGQQKLGPVFTMAPEMRRHPAESDGAPADVYSLGKTLWMMLSDDGQGFDGQYLWDDATIQLHRNGRYSQLSLALIEVILNQATENDPLKRPSCADFAKTLDLWLKISSVDYLALRSEWDLLAKSLFNGRPPRRAEYRDVRMIVSVLNQLVVRPSYNHMLYPDGGGLDLQSIEFAREDGCVAIRTEGSIDILKPNCLYVEVYPEGEHSYFLLDADELPLLENVDDNGPISQRVVEDVPGHYVSARAAQYGVYDYDEGTKLPESARVVRRYSKGKFLIVPKSGPYNHIPSVYDGRHNDATIEQLRQYMGLVAAVNKIKLNTGQSLFNNDSFKQNIFALKKYNVPQMHFVDDRVRNEIETLDFSSCMTKVEQNTKQSKLRFWVVIDGLDPNGEIERLLSERADILQLDGRFHRNVEPDDKTYYLFSRDEAAAVCARIDKMLHDRYETDVDKLSGSICVRGEWKCIAKPTHVFSCAELEAKLKEADDRKDNRLVIDENGEVDVVPGGFGYIRYPVENETYSAGGMYVGKYADYVKERMDELYGSLLNAFLSYLKTGRTQFVDMLLSYDEEDLLKMINSEMQRCK